MSSSDQPPAGRGQLMEFLGKVGCGDLAGRSALIHSLDLEPDSVGKAQDAFSSACCEFVGEILCLSEQGLIDVLKCSVQAGKSETEVTESATCRPNASPHGATVSQRLVVPAEAVAPWS